MKIPADLLGRIGIGPQNDVTVMALNEDCAVALCHPDSDALNDEEADPQTMQTGSDGSLLLSRDTLTEAELDGLQCYHVEADSDQIRVEEF